MAGKQGAGNHLQQKGGSVRTQGSPRGGSRLNKPDLTHKSYVAQKARHGNTKLENTGLIENTGLLRLIQERGGGRMQSRERLGWNDRGTVQKGGAPKRKTAGRDYRVSELKIFDLEAINPDEDDFESDEEFYGSGHEHLGSGRERFSSGRGYFHSNEDNFDLDLELLHLDTDGGFSQREHVAAARPSEPDADLLAEQLAERLSEYIAQTDPQPEQRPERQPEQRAQRQSERRPERKTGRQSERKSELRPERRTERRPDHRTGRQPERWIERDKRKKKSAAGVLVVCFLLFLAAVGGYVYYKLPHYCVISDVTIEAGESCPPVESFLKWKNEKAYIVSGINENMRFEHVQDYEVVIHLYHQNITTTLHVRDTVPPRIQTQDKTIVLGEVFEIEDFVQSITDVTECEVLSQGKPDVQSGGTYLVSVSVRDEGGNITQAEARLEVLQDVTPPVIEGVREITITVGESVSYKRDVTVTDDYDDNVRLEVDNSQVDIDTPGDYPVIYRATDQAGNTAEVKTILHVKSVPAVEVQHPTSNGIPRTAEAVNAEADKILASITNSTMSQYEVIQAIYNWCHSKVAYVNGTPKTNWVDGAYCGIVERRGDCYAYAMTAKCLLTRAGITNMDIERVRTENGMHFWNLVDIGEGWHHFDTCRRADGSTFFYLTDAELMAYSNTHTAADYPNGSHYYDRSLYPVIP